MNRKCLSPPNPLHQLASASAAPPVQARGSHHDRIEPAGRSLRRTDEIPACQHQYSYIGFLGNEYDRCPRRLLLFDVSDASAAGQFVRLLGVVASVDRPDFHGLDGMIWFVLDDGTGIIQVFTDSSCFHGKEGIIINSLGDGGADMKRETVYPSKRCRRSCALPGKNQPVAKKSKANPSAEDSLALGQCVECIGTLEFSTSKNVSCLRLVADSVSIVQDPNAMNLRHLEIMSKEDVFTPSQLENASDSTGIFGIAGNLVSRFGTFCHPADSVEKEKENVAHIKGWETPQRIPKKERKLQPQAIVIRKSHLLRLIKSCSHDDGDGGGISEADLLLILGCMDDDHPEIWVGVLREALEDLKGEGEIYLTRNGKFLPI